MIQTIRKNFGKQTVRIILILLALSMAGITSFTGIFRKFSGISPQDIAIVNNKPILRTAFKSKIEEIERRIHYIKSHFGESAPYFLAMMGLTENPHEVALKELIQEQLLLECAEQIPLELSSEYIMRKLDDPSFIIQNLSEYVIPEMFDTLGGINQKILVEYLRNKGLTLKDFEEAIENCIKRLMVISLATGSLYTPEFVLKDRFLQEYAAKDFTLVHFPLNAFIKKAQETPASEETLKQFFDQQNRNQRAYWEPEKRSAIVWQCNAEEYGIAVSDKEVEEYYKKNQNKFINKPEEIEVRKIVLRVNDKNPEQAQKAKAEKIYQELKEHPTQFAEYAHEYSEDKKSAEKGGLIGFVRPDSPIDPALLQAVFSLSHDGDISLPVRTQEGFEIAGRVSKKEVRYKNLKDVAQEIKNSLRSEKFQRLFANDARRMVAADPAEFAAWVEKKKASKTEYSHKKLEADPVVRKMFELGAGKKGYYKDQDKGFIVEVVDIVPAHPQEYETVKQKVAHDYYNSQAFDMIKSALQQASSLKDNLKELEKTFGAHREKLTHITKDSDLSAWFKKGIPQRFFTLSLPGSSRTAMTSGGGYIVFLDRIDDFDNEAYQAHKKELKKVSFHEQIPLLMSSFIASLEKNATIKVNFQGLKKN